MDLSDTVSYARQEIDAEELRRSSSDDTSTIASTDPPPPTSTVSFAPIVESIREDEDVPLNLQDRS